MALALRYGSLIFAKSTLLNRPRGGDQDEDDHSFDVKEIPNRFPELLEISDALNRRGNAETEEEGEESREQMVT